MIDDPDVRILLGDAVATLASLESESVQTIVTSPPFWNLRDYGVEGQIGLEPTPEEWVERLVEVFAACRRVLRRDGTLWIECGDTYVAAAGSGNAGEAREDGMTGGFKVTGSSLRDRAAAGRAPRRVPAGLKAKDLVGAPWMLAFALRADGWHLRAENIWNRPNPMPQSADDRPTRAHSQVFLLSRSPRYFYDRIAIAEPAANDPKAGGRQRAASQGRAAAADFLTDASDEGRRARLNGAEMPELANARSVWTVPVEPTPFAHFATMATKVVRKCIAAGTSEHGACAECGAPYRRLVEEAENPHPGSWHTHETDEQGQRQRNGDGRPAGSIRREQWQRREPSRELGWEPTCECRERDYPGDEGRPFPVVPCTVLDPFMGSGTTALVARRMGRRAVGVELSPEYLEIARERLSQQSLFGGA